MNMDDLADEIYNSITGIHHEFEQYKVHKLEYEKRIEAERQEQDRRLESVENKILAIREKLSEFKAKVPTKSSVSIQTEFVLNSRLELVPPSSDIDAQNAGVSDAVNVSLTASPVIQLTNIAQLNAPSTSDKPAKKSIEKEKCALEKLLESDSMDSNCDVDSSFQPPQEQETEITMRNVEENTSSDEIEEEQDEAEIAKQALLKAMLENDDVSRDDVDDYQNVNNDNNASFDSVKPVKINLKSLDVKTPVDDLSSDQNFSPMKSSQIVTTTTIEAASNTEKASSFNDLQKRQLDSGCHVIIEPLDWSKFKQVSNKTFLIKDMSRKKSKNDDNDSDENDSNFEKGFGRLLKAAYQTRAVKAQLRAYSESGESDSFYDKDKLAHKRAFVKKFNPSEREESESEDLEEDDEGEETLRYLGDDRITNLSISDCDEDREKRSLLDTINKHKDLLDDYDDDDSCFDDEAESNSNVSKSSKKTKEMKKAEKEAKLKKQIEADFDSETEFVKRKVVYNVPSFSSSTTGSSSGSKIGSEDESDAQDEADNTLVNERHVFIYLSLD